MTGLPLRILTGVVICATGALIMNKLAARENITGQVGVQHVDDHSFTSKTRVHVLRLKPHQDLRLALEDYTRSHHIGAGFIVTVVGSLESATLRLANQKNPTSFSGKFEIVSLVGTLSPDGPHLHISLADETGKTIGGHLVEGCSIYTTAEIVIGEANELQFSRPLDHQTGFNELMIERSKD